MVVGHYNASFPSSVKINGVFLFFCVWGRSRVYFGAVVVWISFFLDHVNVCAAARANARVWCCYTACRHTANTLRLLSRSLVAMETVWVGRMPQGIRRAHRGHKFKGHVGDGQKLQKTIISGTIDLDWSISQLFS